MLFRTILPLIIIIIINLGAFSGCDHWSLYSYFLSHLFISFLIFNGFEGKKEKQKIFFFPFLEWTHRFLFMLSY